MTAEMTTTETKMPTHADVAREALEELNSRVSEIRHAIAQRDAWAREIEELKATTDPLVRAYFGDAPGTFNLDTGRARHKAFPRADASATELTIVTGELVAAKRLKTADASEIIRRVISVSDLDFIEYLSPLEEKA